MRYNGSSPLVCSPLLASKSGDIQPSVPVRKSRSLHSSVPPRMALTDEDGEGTLRTLSHHYENVRDEVRGQGGGVETQGSAPNGVCCRGENLERTSKEEVWVDWAAGEMEEREDLDGTLTNAGQKIVEKTVRVEERQLNVSVGNYFIISKIKSSPPTPRI